MILRYFILIFVSLGSGCSDQTSDEVNLELNKEVEASLEAADTDNRSTPVSQFGQSSGFEGLWVGPAKSSRGQIILEIEKDDETTFTIKVTEPGMDQAVVQGILNGKFVKMSFPYEDLYYDDKNDILRSGSYIFQRSESGYK